MRKRYLLLFIFLFQTSVFLWAQTGTLIEFVNLDNTTLTINGNAGQNAVEQHINIRNISVANQRIRTRIVSANRATGHEITLCFAGQCVQGDNPLLLSAPLVLLAPEATTAAGSPPNTLICDVRPHGNAGTTTATYRVYTVDASGNADGGDSLDLNVTFSVAAASARTLSNASNLLGNPYPNPAAATTTLNYQLPAGHHTAQLKIYDMLGKHHATYNLTYAKGTLQIPVRSLKNGIYFCTLEVDGKAAATRKLIVSR